MKWRPNLSNGMSFIRNDLIFLDNEKMLIMNGNPNSMNGMI
jgi:hypothetical protein